jgi:hypothetical protein
LKASGGFGNRALSWASNQQSFKKLRGCQLNGISIKAVFPNPKIRKFLVAVGTIKRYRYAPGEYGGGSRSVLRETIPDPIDYNDIRVIGGLEWETQTQVKGHIEVGYAFDREIEFAPQQPPDFEPNGTIILRTGINF